MSSKHESQPYDELLSAGRAALALGQWAEARTLFDAAREQSPTADAFEGLAEAAWWLHDEQATFEARERAFHLHREHDERPAAARMATWMATDSLEFRGELAVASGWFQLAHRLLEGLPVTVEHGWLAAWEGSVALAAHNDVAFAREASARAVAVGRALGEVNLEMLGLALEGLALVSEGEVREGMRRLDQATAAALAGEYTDLNAMATTFCYVIGACDRVRDYDRAMQWCTRARAIFEQRGIAPLFSVCTPKYATVLLWRGAWDEAEQELRRATDQLGSIRPPMVGEGLARLGQLLWRRGKDGAALALFHRAEYEALVLLGRAEAALDSGNVHSAVDLANRYLRRVPDHDRLERMAGLELLVRALTALPDPGLAKAAVQEMEATATSAGTLPLWASASLARGQVAAAEGDLAAGQRCFEDAVDLFERAGGIFETARARSALAAALYGLGRLEAAQGEASAALEVFQRLGAVREIAGVSWILDGKSPSDGPRPAPMRTAEATDAGLSPREVEVLRLVSLGKSNDEIAVDLFLSVRTVERHISSIYEKLGLTGRAARAAATAYALRKRIAQTPSP